jgi:hypothetical protein
MSIKTDFPAVQRQLAALQKDVATQALARAVNRTIEQAKTSMSREIRQEFNIAAAKVNAALRINRASFRNGLFTIEASLESPRKRGRSLNLINFSARQTARGVTVKVLNNGGRKLIPSAFITSANGGTAVFKRVGKSRYPIKALQTVDVASMFNTKRINSKVVQFIRDKFPEVFEREAKFYLARFNASRAG